MSNRMNVKKSRSAFTLVELLVVIGIIAMLISILLPTLRRANQQAKSAACKSNLRQLGIALQAYASDNRGRLFPVGEPLPGTTAPTTFGTNVPPHDRWPAKVDSLRKIMVNPWPPPYNPADYADGVRDSADEFRPDLYTAAIQRCPEDQEPMEANSYLLNQHLADNAVKAHQSRFGTDITGYKTTADVVLMGEKVSTERDYYMERDEFDRVVEHYRHGVTIGSNYLYLDTHVDIRPPTMIQPLDANGNPIAGASALDPWDIPDPTPTPTPTP